MNHQDHEVILDPQTGENWCRTCGHGIAGFNGRVILITGGFGFIGSNLIRYWRRRYPQDHIVNVDLMTYAARPSFVNGTNGYTFHRIDIRDHSAISRVFREHRPDGVIHLAAESHVCRSISGPADFISTNINGTFNMIEEFKELWGSDESKRFHHVSTDEVFGELGFKDAPFYEGTQIKPRSPYAASKASSDHIVQSYHHTYGVNTVITNCSNNFGPNQHEEKLIPRAIQHTLQKKPMTMYGTGDQVRDWIYVEDHCKAIDIAFHKGKAGERYCVGGDTELSNLSILEMVQALCKENYGINPVDPIFTNDRPTDDLRYAIDSVKLEELGYQPQRKEFYTNLERTIKWYKENERWI